MTTFGVHTSLQGVDVESLRAAWRRIEADGYHWISISDHLCDPMLGSTDARCLEAISMHTLLAVTTSRVQVGSLVYAIGFRHPAVLAKSITAIDVVSGGRAQLGLGTGWAEPEYRAFGVPFPSNRMRLDQLDEGASVLRALLHDGIAEFDGEHFTLRAARNEPRPAQAKLPIWIGGGGERRTLRIVAQHADGWNLALTTPAVFAHKREVLRRHCETAGRDPEEIRCSVNVALAWSPDSLVSQFGPSAGPDTPGVLTGSDDQVLARIGEYVDAGADQINIAVKAPFDLDGLTRLSEALTLGR